MPLRLSIVTAERAVLDRDDMQRLIVPTSEGQITVLPSHAALMASLAPRPHRPREAASGG